MTPPTDTQTPFRQVRIGDDWYDFEHAAGAQGTDRSKEVRRLIDWYLRRPGATLPDRPAAKAWEPQARKAAEERARAAGASASEGGQTKPSKIRIPDDDWTDFQHATKAAGTDRSKTICRLIAWYLRRPGIGLPERPPLDAWIGEAPQRVVVDDRDALDFAAKAAGQTRAEVLKHLTAWYLRRPGAALPERPPLDAWEADATAAAEAKLHA
ncbi:hypothetical protein ACWDA7_46345 [Streptomyces sp. NPDC001156]